MLETLSNLSDALLPFCTIGQVRWPQRLEGQIPSQNFGLHYLTFLGSKTVQAL
jgi:hypothetical protein